MAAEEAEQDLEDQAVQVDPVVLVEHREIQDPQDLVVLKALKDPVVQ
jgi:hypothetical protein